MSVFSQTFLFVKEAQGQSSFNLQGMLKLYELLMQVPLPDAEEAYEK